MTDTVNDLVLDLLEWLGTDSRPYSEVMEAWRTSCPRLAVWEEANERGLVERKHQPGHGTVVSVSAFGHQFLNEHRSRRLVQP